MEEQQEALQQPWLVRLLKSNFTLSCEYHDSKFNHFCADCLGLLICEKCVQYNEHPGHRVIRVFKASKQDGVPIEKIKKILDISHIHRYVINGVDIVFIFQRPQCNKGKARLAVCNKARSGRKFCVRCGFELLSKKEDPDSKFCSIECKYESVCGRRRSPPLEKKAETNPSDEISIDELGMDEIHHMKSLRKRPRKADHPVRSPFF